jgi:hypothetical protein
MEHEELTSVTRSASTAGLAALAMVIVVLYWALRSPVLLGIAVLVLFAGLSLTAAFAAATVGELNLLSVAFAVLYIGLGTTLPAWGGRWTACGHCCGKKWIACRATPRRSACFWSIGRSVLATVRVFVQDRSRENERIRP